ncbi:uncharacterized protein Nmag_1626 [Natrialba magadii ATCC 43099]|uniref:Uncharacterized protein n=1 Tax=Natrialba magadii (strain ATCC 43099 / DSM 3394 / CCM 3739 / CIP 104546 / IAM 13178 / JCM 8861 / NBRC 102185 / NCIMB 2190 / MS3) TaxID=547559 RepID=D3SUE4_NATMM|nr:uncharacterized protein Nmag_1626 [Natrialba magadii ATCC 43099]
MNLVGFGDRRAPYYPNLVPEAYSYADTHPTCIT